MAECMRGYEKSEGLCLWKSLWVYDLSLDCDKLRSVDKRYSEGEELSEKMRVLLPQYRLT